MKLLQERLNEEANADKKLTEVAEGSFVTLFHAKLAIPRRRLPYVDAGHGHVFLRRADGTIETKPGRTCP